MGVFLQAAVIPGRGRAETVRTPEAAPACRTSKKCGMGGTSASWDVDLIRRLPQTWKRSSGWNSAPVSTSFQVKLPRSSVR